MFVVATAGHVDHGKSTLVRALTGTDPDRLAEEHRRGLTIDLGYAWTTLPDGGELAFVDVPGHERFIGTMLAGLGPVPAVLFVVAADAGWQRQSEEHLAAVDALHLQHGLLVVTRSDLADPSAAIEESLDRIGASSLGVVPAVAVSGRTGAGLPNLRDALGVLVASLPPADPHGRVRLWVDRSFTMRGAGTVATGTLTAGTVAVGDELMLGDRRVVVRGLQALGTRRDSVSGVARVGLNLRGVGVDEIGRGDVLLSPDTWVATRVVDVVVRDAAALTEGLVLYLGTSAEPVRVRQLGADTARLTMPRALPLLAGDRGVLRDPSRHSVAGGIEVLDADPPPLRRRGAARARAATLAGGRPSPLAEVERRGTVRAEHLAALGIVPPADAVGIGDWIIAPLVWRSWTRDVTQVVERWQGAHPLEPGMPLAALRHVLGVPDDVVLAGLLAAAGLHQGGGRVATSAADSLGTAEAAVVEIERRLAERPFAAPDRDDLRALGLGDRELAAAQRAGRLIRLGADVVVLPSAPDRAIELVGALAQPFTVSAARQALDTSRRVAVPLLEHLDATGRTEQVDGRLRRVVDQPG